MKKDFIFQEVHKLKGVGSQLSKYLKKKKDRKNQRYNTFLALLRNR